jgi:Domain of unknown function (DUF1824)
MFESIDPQVTAAWQVLAPYSLPVQKLPASTAERDELRAAVLVFVANSDYQILGICAESIDRAVDTLEKYRQALDCTAPLSLPEVDLSGAVYLKYNSNNHKCYLDTYNGSDRGVLVACQSFSPEALNQMVGHLPLDLFD